MSHDSMHAAIERMMRETLGERERREEESQNTGIPLLAFKDFILHSDRKPVATFSPIALPDWDWPARQVVKATCEHSPEDVRLLESHGGHHDLGIQSYLDIEHATNLIEHPINHGHDLLVVGVIQVLGKANQEGLQLKSERAFLWGFIGWGAPHYGEYFPGMTQEDFRRFGETHEPVLYPSMGEALTHGLMSSWQNFGLWQPRKFDPSLP